MTTFEINPSTGQAIFRGFTPDSIGATPIATYNALASRVTSNETSISQNQTSISSLNSSVNSINTTIANLSPSNVKLGSISQNTNNEVLLSSNLFVDGQITAYAKLESRLAQHGLNIQPWSESTRDSCRFDIWSDNYSREYELSLFKSSYSTNSKSGLGVYKPDNAGTINAYISGIGNTFFCANNGNVGIGLSTTPSDKLHVSGSIRATSGLKLGANNNSVTYASAAPTSGTWLRGDIVHNTAPSASGTMGWICVAAGTPGTWKTWGAISA